MPDVTCPTCGARFSFEEMPPRDPDDQQNTQVGWLLAGRCPKCSSTVEMSFEEMQRAVTRLTEDED